MGHLRAPRRAILALLFVGGITAASADIVPICGTMAGSTCGYGDATVTEYADAASLSAGLAAIGTTTSVNFVGAAPKNGYTFEGSSFPQSTLMFDDNYLFNGSGGGTLYVVGNGYASGAFGIGTGEAVLYDDNSGNGIDIKFPTPVSAVGLIIGDPSLTPDSQAPGVGGFASFNLLFSGGATDVGNIGTNSELPLTGGTSPNFYEIQSTGTGITEINFSDNGSTPTIDTVAYATPEPSYYWLVGLTLTVFLGVRFMRKHKPSFARRALGAAPVAVVAGLAMFAAPVHSFAQVNCNLAVPNNPLTALGLGSVYLLTPGDTGCSQSNNGVQAFVQAAIYDPTAHAIYVYNPLVADGNSGPPGGPPQPAHYAISPIVPKLPSGAVVAIWFGFNGQNLTLTGSAVKNGTCVTGFGQFGYCNTTNFWNAVNADPYLTKTVGSGVIIPAAVESRVARDPRSTITPIVGMVPNRGTANDGLPCPTSRSYSIVDQDPSDNLTATFLLTTEATPREAQNTAANQMKLTNEGIGFNVQINPSDEAVLDKFVDPALSNPAAGKNPSGSCMPWLAKDLSDPTGNTYSPSLALNELQANVYGDPALVSLGDTFTLNPPFTQPPTPGPFPLVGTSAYNAYVAAQSLTRTNQYRAAVNQPLANSTSTTNTDGSSGDASFATFCKGMFTYTVVGDGSPADLLFNQDYQAFTAATGAPGAPAQPFPGMDESLFGFLANRFAQSYDFLGCAAVFNKPNPVTVVLDSMRLVSNSTYYVTPPFTAGP